MKKAFKVLLKIAGGIISFILFYVLVGFCLSSIEVNTNVVDSNKEVTIYIKSNGVHTDIVVPVKNSTADWSKHIKYSHPRQVNASFTYVGIGWGDKGFYLETPTWADLKVSTAFNAAFGLSSTAIHATFYKELIESENCIKIEISKAQYQLLCSFILNSFEKDENQQVVHISTDANYNSYDAFYEAKGAYSLFNTCNTWANNALKFSGLKACLWTPYDKAILAKYHE